MVSDREFRLWYRQPAQQWSEALPLGNGSLGAMLWGQPHRERTDLNIDALWSGGPRVAHAENSGALLRELRTAVLERRDYVEADKLVHGLQGPFNEAYQPLGWLVVDCDGAGEPLNYERSLDLLEGIASVRYEVGETLYEREAFASVPDRVFVMHLRARGAAKLNLALELGSPHPNNLSYDDEAIAWLDGRAPAHVVPHYWAEEPPVVYDPGSGLRFAAGLALKVTDGIVRQESSGTLRVEGADAVTLFVASTTGYAGFGVSPVEDPAILQRSCREVLSPLLAEPYAAIRARHVREHQVLFNRCWLQLGRDDTRGVPTDERLRALRDGTADEGLFALLFHYGRYLLMASSRPGSQPANLQGIWNDQVRPPWSCNWTTNINTEMNYWHAETTNLAECHEPLMELVADLSRAGVSTARDFYGCGGWTVHHNVDLWRSTWPVGDQEANPFWVNWQMGGAWLCQHLWEHYAFSEDNVVLGACLPAHARSGRVLVGLFSRGTQRDTGHLPVDLPGEYVPGPRREGSSRQRRVHAGHLVDQGPFPPLHLRLGDPRHGPRAESKTGARPGESSCASSGQRRPLAGMVGGFRRTRAGAPSPVAPVLPLPG